MAEHRIDKRRPMETLQLRTLHKLMKLVLFGDGTSRNQDLWGGANGWPTRKAGDGISASGHSLSNTE